MEKEIRFSEHAIAKLQILQEMNIPLTIEFIEAIIRSPDQLEIAEDDKRIAQKQLDDRRVLRVVYREFAAFAFVITLCPGRKSRHAKDSL
ncbi:hypothetical protein [Leptolyngbya sp. NIES-2104]|uniref:hypothetical protein n=1 Tax=Leptolyngbya sp. NIES-2104 TaxID=1552121 RepID=UPI0006EC619C|nr:hypothetical protein [Leptolyngbya sp. NIES-2104]GAP94667.1 hypothetical protein NIES2104_11780 [Leptolyngbya sp. NIES-2104]